MTDPRIGLGSFAHGQFAVDYEQRVDLESLRGERLERARAALKTSPLDALLVIHTTTSYGYSGPVTSTSFPSGTGPAG